MSPMAGSSFTLTNKKTFSGKLAGQTLHLGFQMSFPGNVEPKISGVTLNGFNVCPGPATYTIQRFKLIFLILVPIAKLRASKSFPGKYGKEFMTDGLISRSWTKFYVSSSNRYPWVELELTKPELISRIEIVNRYDCCGERLKDVVIHAGINPLPRRIDRSWLSINEQVASFKGPSSSRKIWKGIYD